MAQTSPILRFALEMLHHALENYASDSPRHRKVAVLNLAQAVELAIKAALVENNVPIYEKGARTINVQDALHHLAKLWNVDRVSNHARVELLVDERNAIQHRYGNVDDVGMDYHMETAFAVLQEILEVEFDTDLHSWVRDSVAEMVWTKIRFVRPADPDPDTQPSAASQPDRGATLDFIDGFARFEQSTRKLLAAFMEDGDRFTGSTLDFAIKALANASQPEQDLIVSLPRVYRLRNRAVHGDQVPDEQEVREALAILDRAVASLAALPSDTISLACRAVVRGVKGTRLPTRVEEAQEEFDASPLPPVDPPSSPAA